MQSPFGGFETRVRRHLRQEMGVEWCEKRDIANRSLSAMMQDEEIRPHFKDLVHQVLGEFGRAADKAAQERNALLADHGSFADSWGRDVFLEEPSDLQPFKAVEHVKGLQVAISATRNWAFGIKDPGGDAGEGAVYYPPFLVLSGIPGCGKTMLAKAAYLQIAKQCPTLFITEADMMRIIHEAIAGNRVDVVMAELQGMPNLIFDDFGTEALKDWDASKRDAIISHRWENELRTLITTNLLPSQLREISPRIASRITDKARSVTVAITAPDYRQKPR